MSELDRKLIEELRLKHEEVGKALGVSRQAVSKGVSLGPDYLNIERIVSLHRHLLKTHEGSALTLIAFAKRELPEEDVEILLRVPIESIPDDPGQTSQYDELWIVSDRPHEMSQVGYFEHMAEKHFRDPSKRLKYFLPPEVAEEFSQRLRSWQKDVKDAKKVADIEIFSCGRMTKILPHFIIMDPHDSKRLTGWVRAHSEFVLLSGEDATRIVLEINAFRATGILAPVFSALSEVEPPS